MGIPDALPDTLPISEARARFTDVVGAAQYAGRITHITFGRNRRRVAAVVSEEFLAEALAAMERVEDEDLSAKAREAVEADRGETIPAADLYRELGL